MAKISNALMALVGTVGAAAFFAALFFSGVLPKLTELPILLLLAVGAAGLCGLLVGLTPAYAIVSAGGPKTPKAKKPKKGKKAADRLADDDFADESPSTTADLSSAGSDFDDEYSDSFDSLGEDDAFDSVDDDDFVDDVSESGVANMLDASGTGDDDDPFDISDSFESDVNDIDLAMDDSESFDDQFELSPDSGIDFDADDDDKKNA